MSSLSRAFVVSAAYGFISAVYTRSAFFSGLTFLAFWLFIFAFTYYDTHLPLTDVFFFVPAAVVLTSVAGVALVVFLNVGQLVDVWLTGSGAGDNSRNENSNMPFMMVAIALFFFGTMAVVIRLEGDAFAGGLFTFGPAVQNVVSLLAASGFFLLAVVAVAASAIQVKNGVRFKERHDYMSIGYFAALLIVSIVPAALYFVSNDVIVSGWVAFGVTLVLDLAALGFGIAFERQRDDDIVATDGTSDRHGRLASRGKLLYGLPSACKLVLRVALISGLHAAIFILGAYTDGPVRDMFAPMATAAVLVTLIFGGLYVFFVLLYTWQQLQFTAVDATVAPADDENDPFLSAAKVTPPPTVTVSGGDARQRRHNRHSTVCSSAANQPRGGAELRSRAPIKKGIDFDV